MVRSYKPKMWIPPPDKTTDQGSKDHHKFPEPDWREYSPVTPLNGAIQTQREEYSEHH